MGLRRSLPSHGRSLLRASLSYAPAFLVMAAAYAQPYVKVSALTRDAVVVAKGEFYYGLISNFGILLWCATATACLFTFILLRMWRININSAFLLYAGLLTTVLLFDDFFMLHEVAVPKLLGVGERYVTALYPILIALFLVCFLNRILATSYLVLLSALCFLGLSVITDMLAPETINELQTFFEDGFKFLGIAGWFYYFTGTCIVTLKHGVKENFSPKDTNKGNAGDKIKVTRDSCL